MSLQVFTEQQLIEEHIKIIQLVFTSIAGCESLKVALPN